MTANICSSSPRWIRAFIARRWSRFDAAGDCTRKRGRHAALTVATEPYHPAYFMINGRSMPDDMDPNYAPEYPHQPYNGNPHMHPGEQVLLRIIGQGRWQHPFHEHANHVRVLARDGNLILSQPIRPKSRRAGAVHHHHHAGTDDGWDLLLHRPRPELGYVRPQSQIDRHLGERAVRSGCERVLHQHDSQARHGHDRCQQAINYYEWCQDHNKPCRRRRSET